MLLEENERAVYHEVNTHLPKTSNGPRGNVAARTIDSVRLVQLGLNRLNEVTKQINYYDTSLLSCITLDVEHFHSTTHIKVTSCPCCSIVVHLETARRRVWRDCQRGVHSTLVILGAAWYPLPEGTIQFQEMPLMKSLPARKLSLDDCQKLTEFASVHGRIVRQTSVRQETTMAEAGTSPPACYHQTSLRVHRVMLRLGSNHDESDAPPQPVESNSADSDESEDEVEDIEFDSDESDGNDCVEDGARLHNYDEPQLSSETLFQVGRRSRFGRTIRFNGRFIQYMSIDWSKVRLPHFWNCWSSTI